MTLRYFADGDPLDIDDHHDVCKGQTLIKMQIVDAIHKCPQMDISIPSTYVDQITIAWGFKSKYEIDIDCCVGVLDDIEGKGNKLKHVQYFFMH